MSALGYGHSRGAAVRRVNPNRVLYVGFYDSSSNVAEARVAHLSAVAKMDYVCSALVGAGRKVLIVSPSYTRNNHYYHGKETALSDDISLKVFPTLPWGNRAQRAISRAWSQLFLFFFLLFTARKGEAIVVYHSLALLRPVRAAKRLRRFRILLEVEEVYHEAAATSSSVARREHAAFADAAGFIFSTGLLDAKLNHSGRPSLVCHGTYLPQPDRGSRRRDGRIHVVYAGIVDSVKSGASVAVSAAIHLDAGYHLHVIGFGSPQDIERICRQIETVSSDTECLVSYDGVLTGDDLVDFLQECDVGLSTQIPDGTFNDSSFPSKVLTYLANGLHVVSVRIKAVEQSRVANEVTFYDGQDPKAVAEAIKSLRLHGVRDSRATIRALHSEFISDLRDVLKEMAPR